MHAPRNVATGEPERPRLERATTDVKEIVGSLDFEEWMRDGACVGADPEIFFDESSDLRFWYPSDEALALCRPCPVRVTCLDFALRNKLNGVWGATSDYQRRLLMRKGIPRKRCPLCESRALTVMVSAWNFPTVAICISCGASWETPPGSRPEPDELPLRYVAS